MNLKVCQNAETVDELIEAEAVKTAWLAKRKMESRRS